MRNLWSKLEQRHTAPSTGRKPRGGSIPPPPEDRKGQYTFESTEVHEFPVNDGLTDDGELITNVIPLHVDSEVRWPNKAFIDYNRDVASSYRASEYEFNRHLLANLAHDAERLAWHGLRLADDQPIERVTAREYYRRFKSDEPDYVDHIPESVKAEFREMRRRWEESK